MPDDAPRPPLIRLLSGRERLVGVRVKVFAPRAQEFDIARRCAAI